jgi:hypothetical protein
MAEPITTSQLLFAFRELDRVSKEVDQLQQLADYLEIPMPSLSPITPKAHNKQFSDMTLQELREEWQYWIERIAEAPQWGASVASAIEFHNEATKWIAKREKQQPASSQARDRVSLQGILTSNFSRPIPRHYLLTMPDGTYICTIIAKSLASAERLAYRYRQDNCVFATILWVQTTPYSNS